MMSLIATFWNMFVSMKAQKKYFYYRKKMGFCIRIWKKWKLALGDGRRPWRAWLL